MRLLLTLLGLLLLASPADAAIRVLAEDNDTATIVRFDPRTLRQQGPRLELPFHARVYDSSPDGSRYAFAAGNSLTIIDTKHWRIAGSVDLGGPVTAVSWATKNRVLAVTFTAANTDATVQAVYAPDPSVVGRFPMDHTPVQSLRIGKRFAVVEEDVRIAENHYDPTRIHFFGAGGAPGPVVTAPAYPSDTMAFGGKLFAIEECAWTAYDPASGAYSHHPLACDDQFPEWTAVGRHTLSFNGTYSAGSQDIGHRVTTVDRDTDKLRHHGRIHGFTSPIRGGYVVYSYETGSGITAYTPDARKRWTALSGKHFLLFEGAHMIGGRLFAFAQGGAAYALDPRSGRVLARFAATGTEHPQIIGPSRGHSHNSFENSDGDGNDT